MCLHTLRDWPRFGRCGCPGALRSLPSATLPMALLTAIVRKEALLPDHTASFAATQLLPVIWAATGRHLASRAGPTPCTHVCKELLVRAKLGSRRCCCRLQHSVWIPALKRFKRGEHGMHIQIQAQHCMVCCAGDVLLPGNQLSLARASRASGANRAGCRHYTCHQQHRSTAHFYNSLSFFPDLPT